MLIHLGADHGGFEHKEYLKSALEQSGYKIVDHGARMLDPNDDYPEYAFAVAEAVYIDRMAGAASLGVLVCRSSGGVTIAANKVPSMRAVAINSVESAQHARAHNDALVATLSGEWVDQDLALEITRVFIETPFSGEKRHLRRIKQIAAYEYSTDKP